MGFASVTRFTLFVGARAALLMQCCGKTVERTWVLPHHAPSLDDVLKEACWRKPHFPIKIVLDTDSIDLKQDDLPSAPLWARARVLERQRLAQFPDGFLSGSAEWITSDGKKRALHAGAAPDTFLQRIFERLERLPNPVEALSFFPAEAAAYAGQVAVWPNKGWALLNVLTEASGLRQIVLHDGVAIFTRLHSDCVPSLAPNDLVAGLSRHIASTRAYMPRLMQGSAQGETQNVPVRLFVPPMHKDIGEREELKSMNVQLYVLDAPRGEIVPPEWASDIAWLALAARQREATLPLSPYWLKQRRESQWKRRIALWVLLFFGSAGIYSGASILTKSMVHEPEQAPVATPVPLQTSKLEEVPPPPAPPPQLALDAVIYNGPTDWAVWINGEKHDPENLGGSYKVVGVTPAEVTVLWQDGQHSENLTLVMKNEAQGIVLP